MNHFDSNSKKIYCDNCNNRVKMCINKNCKNGVITCYICNNSRILYKTSYLYCIKCC